MIPQGIVQGLPMFLSEMVKLTTQVLEAREEEDLSNEEEDEDLADELDDLKNDLDIKKNTIELGSFKNEDLEGDDAIIEDGDDFDDFNERGVLYDSPMDEICEVLFFRNILQKIAGNNPAFYAQLEKSLSGEQL